MRRLLLSIMLMIYSLSCYSDTAEQLCIAGGYYTGAQDDFFSGLIVHILSKRDQLNTTSCRALWRESLKVGEKFSKTGKANQEEQEIVLEASRFRRKVYDAIENSSGI